jgi:hypothetical protein
LIHQASTGGLQGTAADSEIHAPEILWLNARLAELLAADTGQPLEMPRRNLIARPDPYLNRDRCTVRQSSGHTGDRRRQKSKIGEVSFASMGGILFLLATLLLARRISSTKIGENHGKSHVWPFGIARWIYR